MKKHNQIIVFLIAFFSCIGGIKAQTPSDAIMMNKRETCIALIYEHGSWDRYWEGETLRGNGNIGTFSRNIFMPMLAIGIIDQLNLIIATPYIQTESSGGQLAGVKGFQDLNVALKAQLLNKDLGNGKLAFLSTLGFATPMTNYLSDYMPYSLGLGTNELSLRGILQYKLNNGVYFRTAVAHLWRGQTEIERDFYYNNGSYYTSFMDVPNAWNVNGALGIWMLDKSLKLEAEYLSLRCTKGDDIRVYNAPQPTNKMEVSQVGFSAHYYFQKGKGFGLLAYGSQIIDGRNMGKFQSIGLGATYQFKL